MLVIDGLTKAFGNLVAVDDVSFAIPSGEIAGLIGPNGAGKTTLFEVVSGFSQATRGQVVFRGKRIDGLKPHDICRLGMARTFQLVESFGSFTVHETVLLPALLKNPPVMARKLTRRILEMLSLAQKADWPVTAITLPDKKALEIGKVLALQPQMALLDEVMAGLTLSEAKNMASLIKRVRNDDGVTFLIVEHRMEIVMDLCEHITVMNFGKKIAEGTPKDVATNHDVIAAYLGKD